MEHSSEILLYQTTNGETKIDVRLENETVWLNQNQLQELFQTDRTSIVKHIRNIYDSGELSEQATCAKIAQVQQEGNRKVNRNITYYNLDLIISVGYRVQSHVATHFRIWATKRLREYIVKGFAMDDERLKAAGMIRYFEELTERIRDIRSSERIFYQKLKTNIKMKTTLIPFFSLILFFTACNSTKEKAAKNSEPTPADSISKNTIDSLFAWEIEEHPNGKMYFLDVPFTVDGKTEYLSLTVAKRFNEERPAYISVIVPDNLGDSPKMMMTFISQNNVKEHTFYPQFEKNQDFCAFRMKNAYATDYENKQVDVIRDFLTFGTVVFVFERKNGEKSSVFVPLYTFKKAYKN